MEHPPFKKMHLSFPIEHGWFFDSRGSFSGMVSIQRYIAAAQFRATKPCASRQARLGAPPLAPRSRNMALKGQWGISFFRTSQNPHPMLSIDGWWLFFDGLLGIEEM